MCGDWLEGFMLSSMVFTHTYCSCEADNYNQAIINYDGKIFKCTARDFREEYHYGYLAESGLIVWDTQRLETRLALKFPAKCQACKLLPCCPGKLLFFFTLYFLDPNKSTCSLLHNLNLGQVYLINKNLEFKINRM